MRLTGFFKAPQLAAQTVRGVGERDQDHRVECCRDVGSALRHPNANNAARRQRLDVKLELPTAASPKSARHFGRFANLRVRCRRWKSQELCR